MKPWKKLMILLVGILVLFSLSVNVLADDDDHEHGNREYFQNDHGDNDHEEEGDDDDSNEWSREQQQRQTFTPQQTEYWNIWSREAQNNPDNSLPIQDPTELKVIAANNEAALYAIPQNGQLLVSGEAAAHVLGGEAVFYPESKICVITANGRELIVRAGSNAVYENKVKTPMPMQAMAYEDSVYIPISIVANGLGFRVVWDSTKQALIFQSI
ncbi:copper amine oxidase N-terminal domain-containing protein [Neobacillus sp. Marseille-QA0830]